MIMRKTLLLISLVLLPLLAAASEEPRTYVIKKGDTLWGISERFIKDPFYWPNLWANNPYLTNPHLIYPGQKLSIYDGRVEIVPAHPEAPPVVVAVEEPGVEVAGAPQTEPREALTIETRGGSEGFVSLDEIESAGTLVDTIDDRILMAKGDQVFVKMDDLAATDQGDIYSLFDIGEEVIHPHTGKMMGYQVIPLGNLSVTQLNSATATGVITSSFREIQRGAKLRPYEPARREVTLKKADRSLAGFIVAAKGGQIALAQNDIVYIDLGAADGLEIGNLLYITRPREATSLALEQDIELPDILLGAAVVVETRPHTASALVLKSNASLFRGDRVLTLID